MEVNNEGHLKRDQPDLPDGPVRPMQRSADGVTMQHFIERAKQLGATGEMSPNLELLLELRNLSLKFDHTHGTVTNNDALVVLANARLGERSDDKAVSDQFIGVHGCPADVCRLLQQLFESSPELLIPFEVAAMLARSGKQVWEEDLLDQLMTIHAIKKGLR